MTIIDAQVHAYAANTPERPWHSVPRGARVDKPAAASPDQVAALAVARGSRARVASLGVGKHH
jgi:hypothetical protein